MQGNQRRSRAGASSGLTKVLSRSAKFVHNETGLLVDPRNHEQLADAIDRLRNDQELCKRLGDSGRKRVREEFGGHQQMQPLVEMACEYGIA